MSGISYRAIRSSLTVLGALASAATLLALGAIGTDRGSASYRVRTTTDVSARCSGRNSEVQQAVERRLGYVFDAWTGCHGIGFARSLTGGTSFRRSPRCSRRERATGATSTWSPSLPTAPST